MGDQLKSCGVCKIDKPLTEFHRDKSKRDGICSTCKPCARNRARRWHHDNKERANERSKEYYRKHSEKIKRQNRKYYWKNRERCLEQKRKYTRKNAERFRKYRQDNKEHRRRVFRAWYENNRDRHKQRRDYHRRYQRTYKHIRKARKKGLPDSFTEQDRSRALKYFGGMCAVCGRPAGLWHMLAMDHWIPLSSSNCPGTVVTNMVPLCHGRDGCNNSKHSRQPQEWLEWKFGKRDAEKIVHRINKYFMWTEQ